VAHPRACCDFAQREPAGRQRVKQFIGWTVVRGSDPLGLKTASAICINVHHADRARPEEVAWVNSVKMFAGAVPTGFEPAISALTGPHVRPLHHGTFSGTLVS
jgi:hypothetical protein